jgi:hypothetical protein
MRIPRTTDEVKVKPRPEPESKRISHFYHPNEREDPANEYCGAESRSTHPEKSNGAQSHYDDPDEQQPSPF